MSTLEPTESVSTPPKEEVEKEEVADEASKEDATKAPSNGKESEIKTEKQLEKQEESQVPPGCNEDSVPEDEALERIRGDAIGSTLYSERFVLSTVMKLSKIDKDLSEDDQFQNDLCSLWDMTIEEDVVLLLLKHKTLDIFIDCINKTEDKRLTEILVGIIGNLCQEDEACQILCNNHDMLLTLLELLGCSDALTLIQLMRLFKIFLIQKEEEDDDDEEQNATNNDWRAHFYSNEVIENFCNLIKNSINVTLLNLALDTFAEVLEMCISSHEDLDIYEISSSTSVGFKTLLEIISKDCEDYSLKATYKRSVQSFLFIHYLLTDFTSESYYRGVPHLQEILDCIRIILKPLASEERLLPLDVNTLYILHYVCFIFRTLGDPFEERIFLHLLTIWHIIHQNKLLANGNDFEDDNNRIDGYLDDEKICANIILYITRIVRHTTTDDLQKILQGQSKTMEQQLLDELNSRIKTAVASNENDFQYCYNKLKATFDTIKESNINTDTSK